MLGVSEAYLPLFQAIYYTSLEGSLKDVDHLPESSQI